MTDYEKLEYIHSVLNECNNGNVDIGMVDSAIEFVEDIREPYFDKDGNLKEVKK
tara:strand:- start:206 stop:367 length:162 start_codon:yes stop_codon:yes gene_type:complete